MSGPVQWLGRTQTSDEIFELWKSRELRSGLQSLAKPTVLVYIINAGLQGRLSPSTMTQPFPLDSLLSATLVFLPLPSPFTGVWGYDLRKMFGITDARRRVLEHFGHKNQHLYEPGFLTGSCKFRISSKCACNIVNR